MDSWIGDLREGKMLERTFSHCTDAWSESAPQSRITQNKCECFKPDDGPPQPPMPPSNITNRRRVHFAPDPGRSTTLRSGRTINRTLRLNVVVPASVHIRPPNVQNHVTVEPAVVHVAAPSVNVNNDVAAPQVSVAAPNVFVTNEMPAPTVHVTKGSRSGGDRSSP